jgi:hypothetical protein
MECTVVPSLFTPNTLPVGGEASQRVVMDEELFATLRERIPDPDLYTSKYVQGVFTNGEVARRVRSEYTERGLSRFTNSLEKQGTFDVPITWMTLEVEGTETLLPFVAATEINEVDHGDMSSMVYMRDQIQTARSYMELYIQDPSHNFQKGNMGRLLIKSALHLLSTPKQLDRFVDVAIKGKEAGQEDWPFISQHFNDLAGEDPNGWRNMQDSFQMLGHLTFDAMERGFLDPNDLTDSNHQMLGSMVPLLSSVGFPKHESSGTWEEFLASRTSVIAIETALAYKMQKLLSWSHPEEPEGLTRLRSSLNDTYQALRPAGTPATLEEQVGVMVQSGLGEIGRRLPHESPEYETKGDVRYRGADATLAYLLMYDIPGLLAQYKIPIACAGNRPLEVEQIEDIILEQLDTLIDPATGSMKRYKGDSYLGANFLTHTIQASVMAIKSLIANVARRNNREPDLAKKQRMRDSVVPKDHEATWPHPVAQLAAWAARRGIEANQSGRVEAASRYQKLSTKYLNQAARSITGTDEWYIVRKAEGEFVVRKVPAFRVPEARVTYKDAKGVMRVPSPHTQLNWAAATMSEAFGLSLTAMRSAKVHRLGISAIDQELVPVAA